VILSLMLACAPGPDALAIDAMGADAKALEPGTPAAVGVVNLLNDPATTVAMLDDDVPLDRRAANGLIDARDEAPFHTIGQVDAVPYVGPVALDRLAAYAELHGLTPVGADHLGTWDRISFTVEQADAVLALANGASGETLDDEVPLDARAVDAILDARPLSSIPELADLYYVGGTALTAMKAYSPGAASPTETFAADLQTAIESFYSDMGADIAGMGGNSLEQALDAIDASQVSLVEDPEDDPYGYVDEGMTVYSHPDVVFEGSDSVWFGAYDGGELVELYGFE
jgi:hypothetical protein